MNTEMHGRQIKRIWFNGANGDETIAADGQRTLRLSATYHGDRDEFWVEEYFNACEVARYNCKFIASIIWADSP